MADYELAKAYVQIIPTTKGIEANISSVLGSEGEKAGQEGGKGIADGLKKTLGLTGKAAVAGLTAASAGLVAFGKSAVGTGSEFDSAMSQVMATMGYTAEDLNTEGTEASETMKTLRGFAQEMGASTAFSASEAAQALNYMALAGYDSKTSMEMLPTVLNLAAAGGMDLASASDMVTDSQSALGLTLDDTKDMVDQMASTSSKSNTSVSQLGEAFLTIGATARSVKGGTKELSTVLGVLADNGIKGSEGGTHLRNILLALQNPTDDARDVLDKLGISVYDTDGNMRSIIDIIGDMQDSMGGMTEEAKTAAISGIFNKTDLSSVNALLGTSKTRFDELGTAIGESAGAAQEMAEVQLDNLAGDTTLFQSALEGVKIAVSEQLTPTLRDFVQKGTEGLGKIQSALEEDGIAGAAGALGDLIGELIGQFAEDLPELMEAGGQMLGAIASGFIGALPTLAEGLPDMVEAVVGLVTSVIGSITETLPDLIRAILGALPAIIDVLLEAVPDLITALCDAIPDIIAAVIETLPQAFLDIAGAIITNFPAIVGAVFEGLGGVLEGIVTWFGGLLGIVNTNREEIDRQVQLENQALFAFVDSLKDTEPQLADYNSILSDSGRSLSDLNTAIGETEAAITTTLKTALESQQGLREEDLQKVQEYTEELLRLEDEKLTIYRTQQKNQLKKLTLETNEIDQESAAQHMANVTAALNNANAVTEEAYEGRLTIIENKYTQMGEVGSAAYQAELNEAKAWYDAEIEENQSYADEALGIIQESAAAWVSTDAQKWTDLKNDMDAYRDMEEGALDGMNAVRTAAIAAGASTFAQGLAEMDETATNGFLRMVAAAKSAGGDLDDETKETVSTILDTFDDLPDELDDAGKNALLGFVYGMEDQIPQLANASNMSAQEIVDTVKKYLGIKSPSTVMQGIGENVIAGIQNGISAKQSGLTSAMNSIGQNMASGVSSGFSAQEGNLMYKVSSMMNRLVSTVRSKLQIHSPSRVFEDIGEMIGAGLTEGIEVSSYDAIDSAADMAEGINDTVSDMLDTDYSRAVSEADINMRAGISAAVAGERTGESILSDLLLIVRELYARMERMQVVLDTGKLVGGIRAEMDEAIGANSALAGRGVAV